MTWQSPLRSSHRRRDVLRAVVAACDEQHDAALPMEVPGVRETFGDEATLLAALQLRWHTRLAAHLEQALASDPRDREAAVVDAWCTAAEELPGVRAVLDRSRLEPADRATADATARARTREHVLLARAARPSAERGRTSVPAGARLEELARRARCGAPGPVAGSGPGSDPSSWVPRAGRVASRRELAAVLGRLRGVLPA